MLANFWRNWDNLEISKKGLMLRLRLQVWSLRRVKYTINDVDAYSNFRLILIIIVLLKVMPLV